jgi:hypothetical protein
MRSAIKALSASPRVRTRAVVPPLPPPHRASPFACFPSQWTLLASALGHPEAYTATHCPAPPLSSPDFRYPQVRRHYATATTRRRRLRPSQTHRSSPGESNCTVVPFICLPRSHITGGELASTARDWVVRDFVPKGRVVKI